MDIVRNTLDGTFVYTLDADREVEIRFVDGSVLYIPFDDMKAFILDCIEMEKAI